MLLPIGTVPAAPTPATGAMAQPNWTSSSQDTWAFRPPKRLPVPVKGIDPKQIRTPVDAFLLQKLNAAGLNPAPPAGRMTLIRRATFDLHGLPPTPAEVDAFVRDPLPTPKAFAKVVERLLASPRYGERYARHWLDVVRYADTGGGSNDYERPNAWRYRDYVVRGFNTDKPYDRFILEQIAGDELAPDSPESLVATGFLRMGPWEHTGMSVEAVTRQQWLDDVTHSTAATFLGLTAGCARCHDHKFDPIPTTDYYRLQAVFASTRFAERPAAWLPGENQTHFERDSARIREKLARLDERLKALQEKSRQALARKHGVKSTDELPKEVVTQAVRALFGLESADFERERIYRKWTQLYQAMLPRYEPLAYSVTAGPDPPPGTFVLTGGRLTAPGKRVSPGALSAFRRLGSVPEPSIPDGPGRRLALARSIASPANPLTARVMVNRIWQWHFGRGLVETSSNFGKMGKRPSHPELLDWLASYFTEHGWSVKAMHRLLMTSAAYQRASQHPGPTSVAQRDPEHRLLSHFTPRRLEAEELRDSILAVSGELSLEMGGPGTFPEINEDLARQPRHVMGTIAPAWEPSPTRAERSRRTLYTYQQRSLLNPLLEVFNSANPNDTCERRLESTVAPQVFSLFNSRFSHDMALAFAHRLETVERVPIKRIDQAFQLAFQRLPTPAERAAAVAHLEKMTRHHHRVPPPPELPGDRVRNAVVEQTGEVVPIEDETGTTTYEPNLRPAHVSPETRALAELCLVLLNANEFVYVH